MPTRKDPDPTRDTTMTGGSYSTGTDLDATRARPDAIDLNSEETYWRQNYASRPYVTAGTPFTEYKNAYRFGADAHTRYPGRAWDDTERDLGNEWDSFKGTSSLTWENAKHAARDAWHRVKDAMERAMPGDSDRDGR